MKEGLCYVWGNKIIFGVILFDLVVVLLGGVIVFLLVFVRDVFFVGVEGYGFLCVVLMIGVVMVVFGIVIRLLC